MENTINIFYFALIVKDFRFCLDAVFVQNNIPADGGTVESKITGSNRFHYILIVGYYNFILYITI